jgi:NADPH:quinone reductase-like Zn-dependent oxidoreductase
MHPSGEQLGEIDALIDTDVLRPIIDLAHPFSQTPAGLTHVEGGRSKGKVVITTSKTST